MATALDFAADASSVNCGLVHGNDAQGTALAWVYLTSTGGGTEAAIIANDSAAAHSMMHMNRNFTDAVELIIERATTNLQASSTFAHFFGFLVNTWIFLAAQYDTAGAAAAQRLFLGNLMYKPQETTSYSTQTAGTGAAVDHSADNFVLGNRAVAGSTFQVPGRISRVAYFTRYLTYPEILRWWTMLRWRVPPVNYPGLTGLYRLGENGVGTQIDWSITHGLGTVNAAVQIAGVPDYWIPKYDYRKAPAAGGAGDGLSHGMLQAMTGISF